MFAIAKFSSTSLGVLNMDDRLFRRRSHRANMLSLPHFQFRKPGRDILNSMELEVTCSRHRALFVEFAYGVFNLRRFTLQSVSDFVVRW